ncbi:MAG: hypothetical protein KTR26_16145 [Flammeovirgaceae bacterium]|nr:hypothetical protein [Flammeovirgaceae bacterium]
MSQLENSDQSSFSFQEVEKRWHRDRNLIASEYDNRQITYDEFIVKLLDLRKEYLPYFQQKLDRGKQ